MRIARSVFTAALVGLSVQAAGAQVAPHLGPQQGLRFTDAPGPDWEVANWDNVYVGPYSATLMAPGVVGPQVTIYCVDFAHSINWSQAFTTNVGYLSSETNITQSRLGLEFPGDLTAQLQRYRKTAFLSSLFESNRWQLFADDPTISKRDAWSGIHAAIWRLTTESTPNFPNVGGVNDPGLAMTESEQWYDEATDAMTAGYTGQYAMDFNEWAVLTDVNATGASTSPGVQEYLVRTTVPEPGTVILLGTGLFGLGWAARRRRRALDTDG